MATALPARFKRCSGFVPQSCTNTALAAFLPWPYTEHMTSSGEVNYESSPVAELALDGVDYRLDAGKQGTAISVSTRQSGTWDWAFVCEARWDGSELRTKALDRKLRSELSKVLGAVLREAG
jgi:hypothetical protein